MDSVSQSTDQAVDVVIYSTPTCTYCNMTKEFLKSHNVAYVDYNVGEDAEKRTEMVEKSGQMGVPVIVAKGNVIVGFDEDKLSEVLGISA